MSATTQIGVGRALSALLPFAARRWPRLLALAGTTLLVASLTVLKPWPMKFIVDHALLGQPLPDSAVSIVGGLPGMSSPSGRLWWGVAATTAVLLASWLAGLMHSLAQVAFGQRAMFDLSLELFSRLQRLSLLFHARRSTGDTIRRVTSDCGCINAIVKDALLPIVAAGVTLVAMVVIMFRLSPVLTGVSLTVVPLLVMALRRYAGPMMQRSYEQQAAEGRIYSDVEQTFAAIPVVQVCRRERLQDEQFRNHAQLALAAAMVSTGVQLRFKVMVGLCTAVGTAAIIYLGASDVMRGRLTIGTLMVFLAYLAALYRPVESIVYSSFAVNAATGSARRVVELLQADQQPTERTAAIDLPHPRGDVSIDSVSFAYDATRDVLHQVTLRAAPGETVAIVGATGAGKTTLLSLVPRLIDPQSGVIRIDGIDVRDLSLASLRRQVAIVPQESFLFPMTIAQNIAYGRPAASRADVIAAARAANADSFIRELPQGYDTPVGERGATLSGGQRQRIAIARALLTDSPILILDEPTSSLDSATEAAVLDALRTLKRVRTTLVIAHRLSTVREADRIVVIDAGRVVESGTHEALLTAGGPYAAMWAAGGIGASADAPGDVGGPA